MSVAVEGLTQRFGPVLAVDDLTFATTPGRVTGFLGPNGAGKTTTLRIVLGLVTMLSDLESVAAVAPDALAALAPDAVWLQMSTVGLAGTEQLAALAEERGVAYVDAPVLGTKSPAEQGALIVLAAAAPDLRDRSRPVFDAVGSRTVWVDAPSGGTRLKLAANTWVLALTEGVAESIAVAEGLGLDPQLFLDTIKGGPTDTPTPS